MTLPKFKDGEALQRFLDTSMFCVCGSLLTGFHEMSCRKVQKLKVMYQGKQDDHPVVRVPKVTD